MTTVIDEQYLLCMLKNRCYGMATTTSYDTAQV